MTTKINASTVGGLVQTADTSAVLEIQTANVTAITVDNTQQVSFTNTPKVGTQNLATNSRAAAMALVFGG